MDPLESRPAKYQITVIGRLEPDWADYLGGLTIINNEIGTLSTTSLTGDLMDQAALMGVLNNLYSLNFPILTVERQHILNEENDCV